MFRLMRQIKETKQDFLVATFKSQSDALWAATVFAANPSFDKTIHYIPKGKAIWYPSATIPSTLRIA